NGQGCHHSLGRFHAQLRQRRARTAIAQPGLSPVELLKGRRRRRNGLGEQATQSAFDYPPAGVDGGRGRTRLLVNVVTQVVQQGGTVESLLGHFVGGVALGPPAHKVRQGKSITTQRVPSQAADAALIQ